MFKKFMSLVLALMIVMSVAVIGFSAAQVEIVEEGADADVASQGADSDLADTGAEVDAAATGAGLTGDGVIYFDAASAGWENASSILFYIYEIGGDKLAAWGAKKKLGGTKGDNNIWGFDAAKLGVVAGKQYGIIFNNFDTNGETYVLVMDSTCFGDTAKANPGKKIENPVDSNKSSMEARWTKSSYGPLLQITSIGSLVGETVPNNSSKYQMFVNFLASKDASSLTNALNYNGKDAQKSIDDTAAALGLSKADVKKAIEEAKTKGHSDTGEKTDWSSKWDESKSPLPEGSSGGSVTTSGNNNNGGSSNNTGSASSTQTGQEETVLFIMLGVMVAAAGVIFFARKRERA